MSFKLISGAAIQFSTVLAGVMSCCVQSVFKKSVISLAGATQALGGKFKFFLASCNLVMTLPFSTFCQILEALQVERHNSILRLTSLPSEEMKILHISFP